MPSRTLAEATRSATFDERDRIVTELPRAKQVQEVYDVDHFHAQLEGKNGGGDPWHTDGRLAVAVLAGHTTAPTAATNRSAMP